MKHTNTVRLQSKLKKKIGMEKLYHKRNVLKREIVNVKIVESIPIIDEKTKI